MCPHRFPDNGEPEARACRLWPFASPKAIKDAFAVVQWYAAPAVGDAHARTRLNGDNDFSAQRRVQNGVLNKVSDRIRNRGVICLDPGGPLGTDKADRTFPGNGPRC